MAFKKGHIPWNKGGTSWRKGLGNPEVAKEGARRRNATYRTKHRERVRAAWHTWKNKDLTESRRKRADYVRKRRAGDLNYKILSRLRGRLSDAVRGRTRGGSHVEVLGCPIEDFKDYLSGQFKEGMSWDNYGKDGWHLDHKIPLSFFDLSDPEQVKKACHFSNIQPLWAMENIIKSNKLEYAPD